MNKANIGLLDEQEIRRTIGLLFPDNKIFEIRVLGESFTLSGYFNNADTLLKAFDTVDLRKTNVYMTLQTLNKQCYARSQRDRFIRKAKASTSDNDIEGYNWLFIDMDPERISDTSSTDEQLQMSFDKAKTVEEYLDGLGLTKPIKAISGNGAHLLYPIRIKNDPEGIQIIKSCLEAIAERFTDDKVKIDTVNFNPSRICKLYGTLAQKGSNSAENPYRMSRIIEVPDELKATSKELLVKVAGSVTVPQPVQYDAREKSYQPFDIEEWLRKYYPHYKKDKFKKDGATKFILDECPFNHNHRAPDSFVVLQHSGAIGFKCSHNSCRDKTWRDFRLLFEPDAYSRSDQIDREITLGWERHNRARNRTQVPGHVLDTSNPDPKAPVLLSVRDIKNIKEPENEYIRTGITELDNSIKGLQKGCVSVLSGLRGAAKSTILSQIMLNAINDGNTVICYSGELSCKNFWKWMALQAAGMDHVEQVGIYNSYVVKEPKTEEAIIDWIGTKFWLWNNNYGNRFADLAAVLEEKANEKKADLIVIDNLMALEIEGGSDKYDAQTNFVWTLKNIAKICNVHILFVAHPRKAGGFLRLNDISGSGNITNIVDNAFIIHRNNKDFDNAITDHLGKEKYKYIADGCTNVMEICKDRENGTQDKFISLWYEPETKRLRNRFLEYVHYGWEPPQAEQDIPLTDDDYPF